MIYNIVTSTQTNKDVERILLWYLEKSKLVAKSFL
jgi:hypothetical protein